MVFKTDRNRLGGMGVAAALAAALLAGCAAPPPPRHVVVQEEAVVVAPSAPPAPYVETITVAPSPAHVWVGGFWEWSGGRYAWRPGHWATPPKPERTLGSVKADVEEIKERAHR